MSNVYLLHFEHPIGNATNAHAQASHYLGYTPRSVAARVADHRAGTGARITAHLAAQGIGFVVARVWPGGTRATERALKRRKQAPKLCPICGGGHAQPARRLP